MQEEYLRLSSFDEKRDFIKTCLEAEFGHTAVKILDAKIGTSNQQFAFSAVTSKGINAQGLAYFNEFDCTINISYGKTSINKAYDSQWGHFVYENLKKKEEMGLLSIGTSREYRCKYNEHREYIRNQEIEEAQRKCTSSLLQ